MSTDAAPDFDIVGFGALNVDYIVPGPTNEKYFDDLERGTERHEEDIELLERSIDNLRRAGRDLHVQLGGSALNTARALTSVAEDLRVGFASVAGGAAELLPADARLDSLPTAIDINIRWCQGVTGTCISRVEDGERTLTTYNDPSAAEALGDPSVREEIAGYLARARVVHVTSFFGPQAAGRVAMTLERLRELRPDVTISVDLGHVWSGAASAKRIMELADILFFNEAELSRVAPTPSANEPEARERERAEHVLADLSPRAGRIVILKKKHDAERGTDYVGRAGAVMYKRGGASFEVMREALEPSRVADSTGAGDVFAAGILAAMFSRKVEAEMALRLGFSAARHKMQRGGLAGYRSLSSAVLPDALPSGQGKVFISHAGEDRELVAALEAFLHSGSSHPREQQFFCTSLALQRPLPSNHLRHEIWAPLRAAEFVVFVVTPSFLASRECTYELGVASALGLPSIPLLAPGQTFDNALIPVSEKVGGHLDNRRVLIDVRDVLKQTYDYEWVVESQFEELLEAVITQARALRSASDDGNEAPPLMDALSTRAKRRRQAKSPPAAESGARSRSVQGRAARKR